MTSRSIIICDTEYVSFEGWNKNPDQTLPREVVQFGAIKLDAATLTVVDTFEQLVQPRLTPQLPEYLIKLTGITQAMVDADGLPFAAAYQRFQNFAGPDYVFASYGGDWQIIALTARLNDAHVMPPSTIIELRDWFHAHAPVTKGVNSGRLAETLGVRQTFKEHTALADCYSIIDAMRFVVGQGTPNPFL